MSVFVLDRLHGMVPKIGPRDLGTHFADEAKNAKLWSGDIQGIKASLPIQQPAKSGVIESIYYLNGKFLTWNEDVDVVRSPLSGLWFSESRFHYTGHFNPKSSNESKATVGSGDEFPLSWFRLGVPAPENPPVVGNTGGTSPDETRSYVYTLVTDWGEEGPPSEPAEHTAPEDSTSWDLSAMDQAPDNSFTIDTVTLGAGVTIFTVDATLHPDGHFLETGEYITISGVTHHTGLNGTHAVTRIDKTQFSIPTPPGLTTLELVVNGDFSLTPTLLEASKDFTSDAANPRDVFFKPDGTRIYVSAFPRVYQYDLTTPWDISTRDDATRVQSPFIPGLNNGIFIKPDGTRGYIADTLNDRIIQVDLQTPWDVGSFNNPVFLSVASTDTDITGVFWKQDGTKMYVSGNTGNSIYQFDVPTAWDVSSIGASAEATFSVATEDTDPQGCFIKSDGTKLYVIGTQNDRVYQYPLSTPWDIATAGAVEFDFSVASEDTTPTGLFWKPEGDKFYIVGDQNNTVRQYRVLIPWEVNKGVWTLEAGWTIGSGVASADGTGSDKNIIQDVGITTGIIYDTSFDVAGYVSGTVQYIVGGDFGLNRTANGTYTEQLTGAGAGFPTSVRIKSIATPNEYTGDVDNVSCQEAPENWSVAREAPINITNMLKRIYRTDANGVFRFVDEIPASQETYTDTIANEDLSTVELETTTWIAPPGDAKGLIATPGGALCAFRENEILFSEPNQPHAWPLDYRQTIDFEIVGVEIWGASVAVMTKGTPYIFTGVHPLTMVPTQLDYEQACISKRSISKVGAGVVYASADGLVFIGPGGPRLITAKYLREPEWRLFNPSSMHGAVHDDRYYGFYVNGGANGDVSGGVIFDPSEELAGFSLVDVTPTAAYRDPETDALYLIDSSFISQFDSGATEFNTFWRSKIFTLPRMDVIRAGRVRIDFKTGLSQADLDQQIAQAIQKVTDDIASFAQDTFGGFAGAALGTFGVAMGPYEDAVASIVGIPSGASIALFRRERGKNTFVQHANVAILDSQDFMFEVPDERFNEFYFELSGNQVDLHSVALATSMSELKKGLQG